MWPVSAVALNKDHVITHDFFFFFTNFGQHIKIKIFHCTARTHFTWLLERVIFTQRLNQLAQSITLPLWMLWAQRKLDTQGSMLWPLWCLVSQDMPDITSKEYEDLGNTSDSWFCFHCKSHNIESFTFHSYLYAVATNNQYDTLASIPGDDSVFTTPSAFNPQRHSSPSGTQPSTVMSSVTSSHISSCSSAVGDQRFKRKKTDHIRVTVVNCNNAAGKRAEIDNMCDYLDPDIIIMTETKIDSSSTQNSCPQDAKAISGKIGLKAEAVSWSLWKTHSVQLQLKSQTLKRKWYGWKLKPVKGTLHLWGVPKKVRLTKKPRRPVKQWSKADWDTIQKETTTFRDKFLSEYQERDVDTNYSDFQQHVDNMLDKHVPTKLSSSRKNVPWLTPTIRRMCRKKQRLYKRAKKAKKNKDWYWGQYRAYQTSTSKALRKAKWDYINGILQESLNDGNSKPFWRYI